MSLGRRRPPAACYHSERAEPPLTRLKRVGDDLPDRVAPAGVGPPIRHQKAEATMFRRKPVLTKRQQDKTYRQD
jgi:hypothetical protein